MKVWQLNRRYRARLALAGAVAGACALIAFPAPGLAGFFLCTAGEAAVFPGSRIHVRCDPGDGAINFFALSVANPDTSRVLSLAATAVAARRPLGITYDPSDLSGAAIGCLNTKLSVDSGDRCGTTVENEELRGARIARNGKHDEMALRYSISLPKSAS